MFAKITPLAIAIFLGSALMVQQPRAAHAASHTDVKAVLREVSNILANSRGPALTGTVPRRGHGLLRDPAHDQKDDRGFDRRRRTTLVRTAPARSVVARCVRP